MSSTPDAIDASASGKYQGSIVTIVLVGVAAGFLSGLFGVGGGILIVPGLVLVAKMDQRIAHGTSLAAVLPISAASLVSYWSHDHVDFRVGLCLAAGALVGAVLGTKLLNILPHRVLAIAFDAAEKAGVTGKAVTPFLLQYIVQASGGVSLEVNLNLAKNNVSVAADIATAWSRLQG